MILELKDVSYYAIFNKISLKLIDDVSFTLNKNQIIGLIGESGVGKTSLARCIMNINKINKGQILFNGIDVQKKLSRSEKEYVSTKLQYIFQDPNLSLDKKMKVKEILAEPLKIKNRASNKYILQKIDEYLIKFGLDTSYKDRYIDELSGGQKQKVSIIRSFMTNPEIIVADEPFSSLDLPWKYKLADEFKEMKKHTSFIVISHDLYMMKYLCDKILVLDKGKLLDYDMSCNQFL